MKPSAAWLKRNLWLVRGMDVEEQAAHLAGNWAMVESLPLARMAAQLHEAAKACQLILSYVSIPSGGVPTVEAVREHLGLAIAAYEEMASLPEAARTEPACTCNRPECDGVIRYGTKWHCPCPCRKCHQPQPRQWSALRWTAESHFERSISMSNIISANFLADSLRRARAQSAAEAQAPEHYGTLTTCPECRLHWWIKGERRCWCGRLLKEGESDEPK